MERLAWSEQGCDYRLFTAYEGGYVEPARLVRLSS